MRLTPWILPLALSAALLTTTGFVFADNHDSEGQQHEPLDDEALEEEYGIKAGSVKREEDDASSSDSDASNDMERSAEEEEEEKNEAEATSESEATSEGEDDVALESGESEERNPEAGTGGTGSPDDAIHSSEEENNGNDDNNGTDDNE